MTSGLPTVRVEMHMQDLIRAMLNNYVNHYTIALRQLRLTPGMPPSHEVSQRMLVDGEIILLTARFPLAVGRWGV